MPQQRNPRGFKILERKEKPQKTIKLFARNGSRYVILINYYFWGLCFRSRYFEFNELEQAYAVYHRLEAEENPELPTARLLQKQSSDF
jgi:hypothetical protein